MAEEFEQYHVPQQSRRDKLRILGSQTHLEQNLQNCSSFGVSFDDQTVLISSYLQNCINHEQKSSYQLGNNSHLARYSSPSTVSNDGVSFTGYALRESDSSSNVSVMDLQTSSTQLNPIVQIQDFHTNINTPQLSTSERFKYNLDQSFQSSGGKGLSLSLSSSQNYIPVDGGNGSGGVLRWNDEVGPVSLGYMMGYASMLKGSSFLRPAQQLLDELCYVGRGIYGERIEADDPGLMDGLSENAIIDETQSCRDGSDNSSRRKSRLISLLHEVCRRYKQYYQHIQEVVAAFESVTGLSNAAPFANLALNSLTKHFRGLKNAITHQLQFSTKSRDKDEIPCFGNSKRGLDCQRPFQAGHQPVWRPQRGLPDHAVRVLKAWLYEHFLHPYPTDGDKVMLAKQTGLSRNQVSNWFINARVRLWKPMVEEVHMLETQTSGTKESNMNGKSGVNFCPNGSNSSAELLDSRSKSTQSDMDELHVGNEQQEVQLSYDNFSCHPREMVIGSNTAGGSNSVSLTLGLHQNFGVGLSKPFRGNAVRRFGLHDHSQDYVVGEFEAQNRQYERNILGGQYFG